MQAGGGEELAESIRRALGDPTTAQALATPLRDTLTDVEDRLRRLEIPLRTIDGGPTVPIWPVSCKSGGKP
jgi:hypothetical protein